MAEPSELMKGVEEFRQATKGDADSGIADVGEDARAGVIHFNGQRDFLARRRELDGVIH